MPNYPSTTRWLSREHQHYAQWRLAQDAAGTLDDRYATTPLQAVKMAFADWKLYLFMIMHHLNLLAQSFTCVYRHSLSSIKYLISLLMAYANPQIFLPDHHEISRLQ
jgi:hypothetical protein